MLFVAIKTVRSAPIQFSRAFIVAYINMCDSLFVTLSHHGIFMLKVDILVMNQNHGSIENTVEQRNRNIQYFNDENFSMFASRLLTICDFNAYVIPLRKARPII